MNITKENASIFRTTLPYKDIFTTVYLIKTERGALLFDCGSYDSDTEAYLKPFLCTLGVTAENLKYVFISHNHTDHAGGLSAFLKEYDNVTVVGGSPSLAEKLPSDKLLCPDDGTVLLDVLKVVTIPGHTGDASGILDTRTNTLISGDCLQMYGIYGSGAWGANIPFVGEHFAALEKLSRMDIDSILTAHDYHPKGYKYIGKEEVAFALRTCREPLLRVAQLITENESLSDADIADKYNKQALPRLGERVARAVRKFLQSTKEC